MPTPVAFVSDDHGALSVDRVALVAGVSLLAAMSASEFFHAGTDMLLATVEPGVEAYDSDIDVVTVANSVD